MSKHTRSVGEMMESRLQELEYANRGPEERQEVLQKDREERAQAFARLVDRAREAGAASIREGDDPTIADTLLEQAMRMLGAASVAPCNMREHFERPAKWDGPTTGGEADTLSAHVQGDGR